MNVRERTIRGDTKYCPKCKSYKSFSEFYPRKWRKIPLSSYCKTCQNDTTTKSRHRTPENYRRYRELAYKRNFGITLNQLEELKTFQNNCCAICGVDFNKTSPHVDHSHVTKVVRGLLCGSCNRGIGLLKDSPEVLTRAASYLSNSLVIDSNIINSIKKEL